MISFDRPKNIDQNKQDLIRIDMHFHTVHSDGASSVNQVLDKIRRLKIGVAITDHNEIKGVTEIFKKKNKSDLVIPGIEITSLENMDILFYFYELDELKRFFRKEIYPNRKFFLIFSKTTLPLKKIIDLSKKYNCVVSIAHPYGYDMRRGSNSMMDVNKDVLSNLNVVEAINGGTKRKNNELAVNFIIKNKKYFTGGSDGHSVFALGNVLTCSRSKNLKEFLDNVKSNKAFVVGQEMKFHKFGEYFFWVLNKFGFTGW